MAEVSDQSFFEKFGKFGGKGGSEKSAETPVKPENLLKEIEKEEKAQVQLEKDQGVSVEAGIEGQDLLEAEKIPAEPVLELGENNQELVEKKEYWEKLIESVRTEKLSDDEADNRDLQSERILEEALRVLVETNEAKIQAGDGIEVVNLFEKVVLPVIEKEDPGINKDAYLDRLHARLSQVEGIKDLS